MTDDPYVVWHQHALDQAARESLMGHRGAVVWFTGLSGSGKSTLAGAVDVTLHQRGVHTFLLDGDNIRHGLCAGPNLLLEEHGEEFARRFGLGFAPMDREENIRRIGAVAQLMASAGLIVLTAFVSPYRRDRQRVRRWVAQHCGEEAFIEVFVDTPLEVCEQRDPKGLYKLARAGKLSHFTGIDDPYEPPESPELTVSGASLPPQQLAGQVVDYLQQRGIIPETT
ncbi:MAG: adenylyl-sulfate kinase [Pirellulaceae bacterium]|nr:MAG: adenylyl-sulfate kinase [Pirellulaceae bacterium]